MPLNAPFEITRERVEVSSDGLFLEASLSYPSEAQEIVHAALLLPAHPFLGGDMSSNVMSALAATLAEQGFMTLAFNYRGIGRSQTHLALGIYQKQFWENSTSPEYEKTIFMDAEAAFEFLAAAAGQKARLSIVGYSFGSLPSLDLTLKLEKRVHKTCLISPPVIKWEMKEEYFQISHPKAFFYSPNDFACPEAKLSLIYEKFSEPKCLIRFDACDHFYLGQERALSQQVVSFLKERGIGGIE